MTYWLNWATIFFTTKALGGSFHALFTKLGLLTFHGAAIGVLMSVAIGAMALKFRSSGSVTQRWNLSRNAKIFIGLYLILVVLGMNVRVQKIRTTPLNIKVADNIPTLLAGLECVMRGESPYHPHVLEDGRVIEHYFLPVLWMGYLPLYAMGWDVRYLNALAHLIFYLLLLDLFMRRFSSKEPRFAWTAAFFLGAVGLHAFSKIAIGNVIAIQHAPFWITYSVFLWSVARDKFRVTLFILPLLILSRELAILLVIPYTFYLFKFQRERFWKAFLWTLGGVLLFMLPFIIISPKGLFLGMIHYAKSVSTTPAEMMNAYYGLCGYLKQMNLLFLHFPLEVSGLVVASVLALKAKAPFQAAALGVIGYLVFILFVSATFGYLFTEPMILMYFLLILGAPTLCA